MSSTRSGETLDFDIHPSRLLGGILIATHAGAVVCVMLAAVPLWLRLLIPVLVAVNLWYSLVRHATLRRPDAIIGLRCDCESRWFVRLRSGVAHPVTILPASYLHPRIVVLAMRFNANRRTRSAILLGDNVDPQVFRRLRVRLLLARAEFVPARVKPASRADTA